MSSIRCVCDHVIKDSTDDLPYKALFQPNQNEGSLMDTVNAAIGDFVDLAAKGSRAEWITKHFGKGYPELDNSSLVNDYLWSQVMSNSGVMYQCEKCGRLLIYRGRGTKPQIFVPEGDCQGTLKKIDPPAW